MAEDDAGRPIAPAAAEFLPADVALPRIEAIVANSRTVWLGTPLILLAFWWRSMPAHDFWLILVIAGAMGLSLSASANGWHRAKTCLHRLGRRQVRSLVGTFRRLH